MVRIYREGFKNREMPRRRPEFESGAPGAEEAKLKQFSDGGGSQNQWLSDGLGSPKTHRSLGKGAGRTDFRITSGIIALLLAVQAFCNPYPQRYEGLKIYEEALGRPLDVVALYVPENPVVFEAGGHYGEDTVRFIQKWPRAKVISFEPNPHSYELLSLAVETFPNISAYPLAVGHYNGLATLHVCYGSTGDNPVFEGASSLLEASDWQAVNYQGPKVQVPCVVLDDWCQLNGVEQIDFMWLDLEGLELQVLQSSPRILESVKAIYTETNFLDFRKGMTQYGQLKKFLEQSRFKLAAHWYAEGFQGNALFVKKEDFEN